MNAKNMNRRGFVTTALGSGSFVVATCAGAQTSTKKSASAIPADKKVFIALPGNRYYAIPEEALNSYKVEVTQFNAELAEKRAVKSKTDSVETASQKSADDPESESKAWNEFVLETEKKGAQWGFLQGRQLRRNVNAVAGVRG